MHGFVYIVSLAWTEDFLKVLSLKMYKNKYFSWQRKVQLNSQSRFWRWTPLQKYFCRKLAHDVQLIVLF